MSTNIDNNSLGKVLAFDKNSDGYNNNSSIQYIQGMQIISETVPKACELVREKQLKELRILDAGCGNGLTTLKFYIELRKELIKIDSKIDIIITGIDISPNMVQQSINNTLSEGISLENFKFYDKNIEELSDEDGEYDIIFSNAALHWCTPKVYKKIFNRLKKGSTLTVDQGGENCYKELHNIVWEAIKLCDFNNYYDNWSIPLFYPSQTHMINLLEEIGYKNIAVRSERYVEEKYHNLIDAFANASLLLYLDRLPDDDSKDRLRNKYYELCQKLQPNSITVHRLNIIANK